MLTIFTTPKAFQGEFDLIQRNAIQSWLCLRPACEIILIGDDPGVAEAAQEFGVRHVAQMERNEYGTPLLNSIFAAAEQQASHDWLCYINADIILLPDFMEAIRRVQHLDHFLLTGQRWDLAVKEAIAFDQPDWADRWRLRAIEQSTLHYSWAADYFFYPRGLFADLPPFYLGRPLTDNWFIFRARQRGAAVIDATPCVVDIHQNHGYGHVRSQTSGERTGLEQQHNQKLAASMPYLYSLLDATHILPPIDRSIDLLSIDQEDGPLTGDQYRANLSQVFASPVARSSAIYRQMIAATYWHAAEVNWRQQRRPLAALLNIWRARRLQTRSYPWSRVFNLMRQSLRRKFLT